MKNNWRSSTLNNDHREPWEILTLGCAYIGTALVLEGIIYTLDIINILAIYYTM